MTQITEKWVNFREALQAEAHKIDPSVRLVTKNSWFWKFLAKILSLLMIMTEKEFLEGFATTLGPIQAYPESWPYYIVEEIVQHETRHTRQCRWFGLGIHPWVGFPFMALAYLLLPVPVILSWVRYRLELDADAVVWRWMLEHGYSKDQVRSRAEFFADTVSGPNYGYAVFTGWAHWGFRKKVEKVIKDFEAYSCRAGR